MTRSTHSVYLPCEKRPLRRLSRFWAILSTIKNHLMAALNHNSDFFTAESSIVFDNVIKTPVKIGFAVYHAPRINIVKEEGL